MVAGAVCWFCLMDGSKNMVRFSPMAFVACLLCAGIFYLTIDSPQSSRLNADDLAQRKADIQATEQMARDLMEALKNQQALNQKLTEADSRTIEVVDNLQSSIARLSEHVKDSVPTREEVTKLVSAKTSEAFDSGECTCGQKLADMQKQIDELKAKVASLESAVSKTSSSAAAASYGTTTSPVASTSGGSTGSVKSGGSTGSVVRSTSGGSTGSTSTTSYLPRWQNHDGLSRSDHAAVYHGLNTAGMTQSQINAALDADHDRFGPMHDGILASRTRSVTRTTSSYAPTTSNCPGGVCPTGPQVRTGGGLLGFGILGRR